MERALNTISNGVLNVHKGWTLVNIMTQLYTLYTLYGLYKLYTFYTLYTVYTLYILYTLDALCIQAAARLARRPPGGRPARPGQGFFTGEDFPFIWFMS